MGSTDILHKHRILSPSTIENIKIYRYKLLRNKLTPFGVVIVLVTVFIALFAEIIMPYPAHAGAYVDFDTAGLPPSPQYLFGTDIYGRDLLSRCIYAFNGALKMAIVVLLISVPFGVVMGLVAAYTRGTVIETIIMRITDIFLAVPKEILALSVASMLTPSLMNSMLAITVVWWTWHTRMVYSKAISIRQEYFVINAELIGASKFHIIFKEIFPNCISLILTKMTLDVGWVILVGAALSFVGLGEQPPTPAFGSMISEAMAYMPRMWWLTIFPSACIAFIILGFNLLGDGISDMLDLGRR